MKALVPTLLLTGFIIATTEPRSLGVAGTAQDEMTPALAALADTERAFAKAATVKGIRDSFLEFFADDAVALVPEPASWKARLRSRPAVPFSEHELVWEPRVGDIAGSGELGWLTGPSTFTNKKDKRPPQHGNYLSVWRREPDAAWKVLLDIGSDAPSPVPFEDGFRRYVFGPRYVGKEGKAEAAGSLVARDKDLNARLATAAPSVVYADFLAPNARLHRDGMVPRIGRAAAIEWLQANTRSLAATIGTADAARSGDLGYSYGTYATTESPAKGSYMRIWSRTREGQWLIVTEVTSPPAGR
jgi:ketosteroid isomerase-like protein